MSNVTALLSFLVIVLSFLAAFSIFFSRSGPAHDLKLIFQDQVDGPVILAAEQALEIVETQVAEATGEATQTAIANHLVVVHRHAHNVYMTPANYDPAGGPLGTSTFSPLFSAMGGVLILLFFILMIGFLKLVLPRSFSSGRRRS